MVYKFKEHEIEVYDSIDELPIFRYQKFTKYQMMQNDIGDDFADYDARTQKGLDFLKKGMVNEAIQEFNNRRQMVFNAYNEFSAKGKALAVLVKRIDDKIYSDNKKPSPSDLDIVLNDLNNIGFDAKSTFETLKENGSKINQQLKFYFPKKFSSRSGQNYLALRIKRINQMVDSVIEQKEPDLHDIEKEILMNDLPNSWNIHDEGNLERHSEIEFQKLVIAVAKNSNMNMDNMTVKEFYSAIEYLEENSKTNRNE